ncbi:MAG: hypothetical protein ABF380_16250 [Akkermansiaceae bacterium]|jgi:ABC-type uncharacterized transport system fused permease/ATPase subunit
MEREQEMKTAADVREEWIGSAEVILGAGKGHMGIITFLRSKGVERNEAKEVSFDIFDEAKRRLMRSQLGYRVVAWGFIALGILLPIALFLLSRGGVLISAVPIIGGTILLGKLVNPARLPEK